MREGKKSEGGGLLKPPPPGSYRVKLNEHFVKNTYISIEFPNFPFTKTSIFLNCNL